MLIELPRQNESRNIFHKQAAAAGTHTRTQIGMFIGWDSDQIEGAWSGRHSIVHSHSQLHFDLYTKSTDH